MVNLLPVFDKQLGNSRAEGVFEHDDLVDADVLERSAVFGISRLHLVKSREARKQLPKDSVVAVEVRRLGEGDEEL